MRVDSGIRQTNFNPPSFTPVWFAKKLKNLRLYLNSNLCASKFVFFCLLAKKMHQIYFLFLLIANKGSIFTARVKFL